MQRDLFINLYESCMTNLWLNFEHVAPRLLKRVKAYARLDYEVDTKVQIFVSMSISSCQKEILFFGSKRANGYYERSMNPRV